MSGEQQQRRLCFIDEIDSLFVAIIPEDEVELRKIAAEERQ